MISRGPRPGFFVFTFASVHGFRFALPICTRAIPEPAMWNVSYSSFASLLVQRVRPAVLELVERERDRAATRERVDQERAHPLQHRDGNGRTPRKTPGSIATVAADRPRPASICATRPPVAPCPRMPKTWMRSKSVCAPDLPCVFLPLKLPTAHAYLP